MNRDDIIRMAREAGLYFKDDDMICEWLDELRCFAALAQAAERNKLAAWMRAQGYATGHGDTTEDLLEEIDHIDWLDRGVDEWREEALSQQQKVHAAHAKARTAIAHLQCVLNKPRTFDEQQAADTAARDWLESIGSEPE
jgi:hypothetical protein